MSDAPWRIDVHSHILSERYMAEIIDRMPDIYGFPWPQWSTESALGQMDRWGIQAQLLSLTDPGLRLTEPKRRAAVARQCNEEMAELVAAHPTRFGALGAVPLPDPDQAAAEAEHALDVLNLDGLGLLSSQDGVYLGDPAMEPLYEVLDDRSCWVIVHPVAIAGLPASLLPPPTIEFAFDLTRAAVNLITQGVLDRFPRIRWCLAQAGGALPYLAPRVAAFMAMPEPVKVARGMPPAMREIEPAQVLEALGHFYYDTALATGPTTLAALRSVASLDHILYGSDLPFAGFAMGANGEGDDPSPQLSETFTEPERRRLERDNALLQFPRIDKALEAA